MNSPDPGSPANPYAPPTAPQFENRGEPGLPATVSAFSAVKFGLSPPGGLVTILIGMAHLFIPVAGPIALFGYEAEITCRLARRESELPALRFADFSANAARGIVPFFVQFLFSFAAILLGGPLVVAPMIILQIAKSRPQSLGDSPSDVGVVATVVFLSCVGLLGVLIVLVWPVLNAAATRAALSQDFATALKPSAVLDYAKRTFWPTLGSFVAYGFLGAFVALGGTLLFGVGLYLAIVALQLGQAHLRWQLYERYLSLGGAPVPIKMNVPVVAPIYT